MLIYIRAACKTEYFNIINSAVFYSYIKANVKANLTKSKEEFIKTGIKMAIYCPQGSGTLRQQLLMMH